MLCIELLYVYVDYVDARFWSLVGVPFPVLPSSSTSSHPSSVPFPSPLDLSSTANVDMSGGTTNNNTNTCTSAPSSSTTSPPSSINTLSPSESFDEYSDLYSAYDLLISDGTFFTTVLLSPLYNKLVEQAGIAAFTLIQLNVSVRYDELKVGGKGIMVARDVHIIKQEKDFLYVCTTYDTL